MGGVAANAPGPCACRCLADESGSYGWMRRCRSADSARWAVLLPMRRAPAPAAVSPMNRAPTGGCGGVGAQILRDGVLSRTMRTTLPRCPNVMAGEWGWYRHVITPWTRLAPWALLLAWAWLSHHRGHAGSQPLVRRDRQCPCSSSLFLCRLSGP